MKSSRVSTTRDKRKGIAWKRMLLPMPHSYSAIRFFIFELFERVRATETLDGLDLFDYMFRFEALRRLVGSAR